MTRRDIERYVRKRLGVTTPAEQTARLEEEIRYRPDPPIEEETTESGDIPETFDDLADGVVFRAFTDTEKTKLAGIAAGATANSSDATLLNRANHTGTQSADTITDGLTNRVFTSLDEAKLNGIEPAADVTDAGNVGSSIHGATAKTTPVNADTVPLIDSAASNVLKKVTWANVKATLKSYFDTLYATLVHTHATADITSGVFPSSRLAASPTDGYILMDNAGTPAWVTPALEGNIYALGGGSIDGAVVVFDGTSGNLIRMADGVGNDALIANGADLVITTGSRIFLSNGATIVGATGTSIEIPDLEVTQFTILNFLQSNSLRVTGFGSGVLNADGSGNVSSGTHNHLSAAGGGQLSNYVTLGPFYANDLAATATVSLEAEFFNTATAVSRSTGEFYAPRSGEIVGIYAMTDANRTGGSATIRPTVNGTAQTFDGGASCVIDASNTRRHSIHVGTGDGEDFASGNRLGLQVVTSGWGPTTANLVAFMVIRIDF